jgi:hypothetical protein
MIVTLCGSSRFEEWFHRWNQALTLDGHLVFGMGSYPSLNAGNKDWYTEDEKSRLDQVHKRKIDASEAILVLNVFGHIGESTLGEIRHAESTGKLIYFLGSWGEGYGVGTNHYQSIQDHAKKLGLSLPVKSPIATHQHPFRQYWDLLQCPAGERRQRIISLLEGFGVG